MIEFDMVAYDAFIKSWLPSKFNAVLSCKSCNSRLYSTYRHRKPPLFVCRVLHLLRFAGCRDAACHVPKRMRCQIAIDKHNQMQMVGHDCVRRNFGIRGVRLCVCDCFFKIFPYFRQLNFVIFNFAKIMRTILCTNGYKIFAIGIFKIFYSRYFSVWHFIPVSFGTWHAASLQFSITYNLSPLTFSDMACRAPTVLPALPKNIRTSAEQQRY